MELSGNLLVSAVRNDLIHMDDVARPAVARRFAPLFTEGDPADEVYFIESGLVKLSKRGDEGKELILQIVGAGQFVGEQAIGREQMRSISAEMLQDGTVYSIQRDAFVQFCNQRPELWPEVSELLVSRKKQMEKKIELLCLKDVEYRIVYYLLDLATSIGTRLDNEEYSIPLSQGELASLIGATRETTSTTLNTLARSGLIRLGRRQLILSSIEQVQNVLRESGTKVATSS